MKKILATLFAFLALSFGTATAASAEGTTPTDPCCVCGCPTEYKEETAWVKGYDYPGANWAMYTALPKDEWVGYADLVVGRKHTKVGHVHLNRQNDTELQIVVHLEKPGAILGTIHIEGTTYKPTKSNPAPGQFPIHQAGGSWVAVITVPYTKGMTNYYGIHAEVLLPVG